MNLKKNIQAEIKLLSGKYQTKLNSYLQKERLCLFLLFFGLALFWLFSFLLVGRGGRYNRGFFFPKIRFQN